VSGVRAYLNVYEECGVFVHACMRTYASAYVLVNVRACVRACLLINVRSVQGGVIVNIIILQYEVTLEKKLVLNI